ELLQMAAARELARLQQSGAPFVTAVVSFWREGEPYPLFKDWQTFELRRLGRSLTASLRPLEVIAELHPARVGILLPETDEQRTEAARERFVQGLGQCLERTRLGRGLQVAWSAWVWQEAGTEIGAVLELFDREPEPDETADVSLDVAPADTPRRP